MSASRPTAREQLQAILLAALCSVLFLRDSLLPGRAVLPFPLQALEPWHSEAIAAGAATEAELLRGNPSGGDKYNQSLTWDRITHDGLRQGRVPLWTRDIGGGAPVVPQMGQIYQPWSLLLLLLSPAQAYGLWFLLHQVVLGWLCYRFLRRIGTRHDSALLGVVAAVLGLWTQARVHHNVILTAVLPAYAMLSCVHQLVAVRGGARAAALLALGTGLSWLGGMPQASLLLTYTTIAWALWLALGQPRGQRLRPLGFVALGLGLGGVLSLAQMGPVLLAAAQSARTPASAAALAAAALEADHLLTLWWPDLLAWPSEAFYGAIDVTRPTWAALLRLDYQRVLGAYAQHPETAFAVGIPALGCALLAPWHPARRTMGFFAGLVALGFLAACATWPIPRLAEVVPGAAAGDLRRCLLLCALGLPVLAALGMDRLAGGGRKPWPLLLFCAALALASALLWTRHLGDAAALQARTVPALAAALAEATGQGDPRALEPQVAAAIAPGEAEANRAHLLTTYGRAALVAALTLLLAWLRRQRWTRLCLPLLAAAELAHAGMGTIAAAPASSLTLPRVLEPVRQASATPNGVRPRMQRLAAAGDQRRGPWLRPNLPGFFGLEDLAAYSPLPPRRLEELWTALEPDRPGKADVALAGAGVDLLRDPETLTHPMLDVLDLRFVLAAREVALPGVVERTPAGTPPPFRLYERTTCLPRATFVTRVEVVPDKAMRLARLADRSRDAARGMLLEELDAPAFAPSAADAEVLVVSHQDERVVVRVRNAAAGYLRLADPWDAGWVATVDGLPARIWIADHYLRAVHLEPGEHEVVLRYDGPTVRWPRWLSLLGLVAISGLWLWGRHARGPSQRRSG